MRRAALFMAAALGGFVLAAVFTSALYVAYGAHDYLLDHPWHAVLHVPTLIGRPGGQDAASIAALMTLLAGSLGLLGVVGIARGTFVPQMMGSARFARLAPSSNPKLGFEMGTLGGQVVREELHAIVCARSGAGKGVSVVVPNLLTYHGSMIVFDPKGELVAITARRRRELGQQVVVIDPFHVTQEPTTEINPLVAGRLEIVFPDWKVLPELGVYAIYPHRRFLAPKVKVFLEALRATYGDSGRDPWWVEAAPKRRARTAKLR